MEKFAFESLAGLSPERRRLYYEMLASNITICIRGVWSDPLLSGDQMVEEMKCLNEILHHVLGMFPPGRLTDADVADTIDRWVQQCPGIRQTMTWALINGYGRTQAVGDARGLP